MLKPNTNFIAQLNTELDNFVEVWDTDNPPTNRMYYGSLTVISTDRILLRFVYKLVQLANKCNVKFIIDPNDVEDVADNYEYEKFKVIFKADTEEGLEYFANCLRYIAYQYCVFSD